MRFAVPVIQSMVLPNGATTGKRILIDGVNGVITMYDSTSTSDTTGITGQWSATGQEFTIWGSGTGQSQYVALISNTANGAGILFQANSAHWPLPNGPGEIVIFEDTTFSPFTTILFSGSEAPTGGAAPAPYFGLVSQPLDLSSNNKAVVASQGYDPANLGTAEVEVMGGSGFTALTLATGYAQLGSNHAPGYMRMNSHTVMLRGALHLSSGAVLTTGSTVMTLPSLLWPTKQYSFTATAEPLAAGASVVVNISTAGVVTIVFLQTGYSPHWVSFDGVTYDTFA